MKFKKDLALLFLICLIGIFFYPIFLGKVPMPLDALVGAYYPWLDYKWGYTVGVPFKNIALSDVFSQVYPWRLLSIEAFRQLHWPLWNPYSFSGTPLLANWLSAPFYPLNIFLLLFGNVWGWSLLIISQPILSSIFMCLYLKIIGVGRIGQLIGSVTFSFSGFMMSHLEYATIGQIMLWLPLQLFLIEKYLLNKKYTTMAIFGLTFFPVLTGGFFQPALYLIGVSFTYGFVRFTQVFKNKYQPYLLLFTAFIIGISTAAIQIIPTYELYKVSIREYDHNIIEYKYGLLPLKNLLTFVSPDFFGNPATNNYWGPMTYQETSGYFGIITLILVIFAILNFKKSIYFKYYTILFFTTFLFAFNNPISRLVYIKDVIGVSTGYASRWLILTGFAASVLIALATEIINLKKIFKITVVVFGLLFIFFLIMIVGLKSPSVSIFSDMYSKLGLNQQNQHLIAVRNMILPLSLISFYLLVLLGALYTNVFQKKLHGTSSRYGITQIFLSFSLMIISIDLLRYGWKFTPFSSVQMTKLSTPITKYLNKYTGYFRIEREWGPVLPPNTWIYSHLYSASGYDPLVIKSYARWYRAYQTDQPRQTIDLSYNSFTRYLESNKYNPDYYDLFGIKYLVAIKRNAEGKYDPNGNYINPGIPEEGLEKVFSEGKLVILENKTVMPRTILYDKFYVEPDAVKAQEKMIRDLNFRDEIVINHLPDLDQHKLHPDDNADIINYLPNEVTIHTTTVNPTILMLTDTYYPGWKVYLDNLESKILIANGIYRAVEIPEGEHKVVFSYKPNSFKYGAFVTLISLLFLILIYINAKKLPQSSSRASQAGSV